MKTIVPIVGLAILFSSGTVQTQDAVPTPPPPPTEEDDGGRIVGGDPAESTPWQVQLYTTYEYTEGDVQEDLKKAPADRANLALKRGWERQHRCGGVYIGDFWVLTAAHCIIKVSGDVLTQRRVRLGTQNLEMPGTTWRIERVTVHKGYDDQEPFRDDIALIRIAPDPGSKTDIDPLKTSPIRLIGSKPGDRALEEGDRVRVTGWGLTKERDSGAKALARDGSINRFTAGLRQLELSVLAQSECDRIESYRGRIKERTICVGKDSGAAGFDSCNGDSGGPLTRAQGKERVLVGLVSWGRGCALADTPGIYTRVAAYTDWIEAAKRRSKPGFNRL
jgi:secreted trypsin-like serine protease